MWFGNWKLNLWYLSKMLIKYNGDKNHSLVRDIVAYVTGSNISILLVCDYNQINGTKEKNNDRTD